MRKNMTKHTIILFLIYAISLQGMEPHTTSKKWVTLTTDNITFTTYEGPWGPYTIKCHKLLQDPYTVTCYIKPQDAPTYGLPTHGKTAESIFKELSETYEASGWGGEKPSKKRQKVFNIK